MTSAQDVQQSGEPAAPRVVRLPSLRRLLRPGPTLVLLALLVGAASAPPDQQAEAAGRGGGTTAPGGAGPAPQVPGWQQEADPRTPVAIGTGTPAPVGPSPVALPLSPVALVGPPAGTGSAMGVGPDLWAAYRAAAGAVPASCHLDVRLLAAIGQVESGSLAGRALDTRHRAVPPVLGPVLDGTAFARIPDTDRGRWDGDPVWDRAVGPMQFILSTWARWGVDADGDGVADPQDIEDAARSAADYLCAGGRDLAEPAGLRAAILSYNHSAAYLATVLALVPRMTPGGLGTGVSGGGLVVSAVVVGPPSGATAPPAPARPAAHPTTASGTPAPASPTTTASVSWSTTTSPSTTTSASTTTPTAASVSSTTTASPTGSTTSSSTTSTTTTTTTATTTTTTTTTTTSPTGATTSTTSSPSSSTTTPACPDGSTSGPTTSGTTSATSPSGTASPSPTASCTTTASPTQTPVPSTSSATAAEATLLGHPG